MSNSKNIRKRRAWPDKRRAQQAKTIRQTKPWKSTTGPRTNAGKATVSQNATKSGLHSAEIKGLKKLLSRQKKYLKTLKEL